MHTYPKNEFLLFLLVRWIRVSSINISKEDESDVSAVLGYIKQMLMEDNTEENYSMFHDSLALQDTTRYLI